MTSTTAIELKERFVVDLPCRLAVVGASSRLGASLVRRALADGVPVTGTYRRRSAEVEELEGRAGDAPSAGPLHLRRLDVRDDGALEALTADLGDESRSRERGDTLAVVYCCGLWRYGAAAGSGPADFDQVVGVGLRAPYLLTAGLLRHVPGPLQIIVVTGLGGSRNAVALHALYALVTNGVYSLVRSVGAELAGSDRRMTGVALGLYDKGQPYIRELAAGLGIRRPGDLSEAAEVVYRLARWSMTATNGSVIELTGGLDSYRDAIRFLAARERDGAS